MEKKNVFLLLYQSPISEENLLGMPRQTSLSISLARIGQKPILDQSLAKVKRIVMDHDSSPGLGKSSCQLVFFPSLSLSLTRSFSFHVLASFSPTENELFLFNDGGGKRS